MTEEDRLRISHQLSTYTFYSTWCGPPIFGTYQDGGLENLPNEIKLLILANMPDYSTLYNLISVSAVYLKAFLMSRETLLTRITLRELSARGVNLWPADLSLLPGCPSHSIEWLEYSFRDGVRITDSLYADVNCALKAYFAQLESKQPLRLLRLSMQELKALRSLDDLLI